MTIAGVDGCPGGWVAAIDRDGQIEIVIVPRLEDLVAREPFTTVVVDIPIGLTDAGSRLPDTLTRKRLGPIRGTSVMPAPIRSAAYATSHAEATAARRAAEGKGVSIQAYGIYAKVAEVDALMQGDPEARKIVVEGHPEVSFCLLSGGPIVPKKKTTEGKAIRLAIVESVFGTLPSFHRPPRSVATDDILDAFSLLWTARRIVEGTAVSYPEHPELDRLGLPMRIVA